MSGTLNKGTLDKGSLVKTFGGGGSSPTPPSPTEKGEFFVKVIDYDGTVIDEQWLDDGAEYTLPANPDRTDKGLVFQEWSCSQDIVNGKVTIDKNNVMIGAIYTTVSGQNEFDIEVNANTGLTVTFNMNGTKDWGDGSATDTSTSHTYSQAGKYTIKCDGTAITASSSSGLFGQNNSYQTYNFTCRNIRIATVQAITSYAFQYCKSLDTVTLSNKVQTLWTYSFGYSSLTSVVIPSSATNLRDSVFIHADALQKVVFPNTITTIEREFFFYCYKLEDVVLPKSLQTIGYGVFSYCENIKKIIIPENVTSIGGTQTYSSGAFERMASLKEVIFLSEKITSTGYNTFRYCNALTNVVLSNSITTLGYGSFQNCINLCLGSRRFVFNNINTINGSVFSGENRVLEYDFSSATTIPTIANASVLGTINKDCKIKVPSALYDSWIVAQYWSDYANYIVAV